jgi:hypothetical protein
MRQCPFDECKATIDDSKFACARHWFQLSQNDRQTIHAAYADYQAGNIDVDKLREVQQEVLGERGTA